MTTVDIAVLDILLPGLFVFESECMFAKFVANTASEMTSEAPVVGGQTGMGDRFAYQIKSVAAGA